MIVDKIENMGLYKGLSQKISKAFDTLKNANLSKKPDGKYEIDGDDIFYMVSSYITKSVSENKFEAHKKYIDIQYVLDGEELVGYSPVSELEEDSPYDEDKDCALYTTSDNFNSFILKKGTFCLFYPHDAHMPGCYTDKSSKIRKVVIKVRVED